MTERTILMPLTDTGRPFNISPAEAACIARCAQFLLDMSAFGDQVAPTPTPGGSMASDAQIALDQAVGMRRAGPGFVAVTRSGLHSMAIVVFTCEFTLTNLSLEDREATSCATGLHLAEVKPLAEKFRDLGQQLPGQQKSGLEA